MTGWNRREFLASVGSGLAVTGWKAARANQDPGLMINTARGLVEPDELSTTLMHEHVMVDFIGADKIHKGRYDPEEVFRTALPHLQKVRSLGCRTLVECTPAYLGRDPALLARLSEASGLHLITNTGYYGAAKVNHVPQHAYRESAEQLAERWIEEFRHGIEGTGIKPGFMKIGVEKGPLSEISRKLARAAALTHKATGLTIASHTGEGGPALEQIEVLKGEGVAASAFIWVHAQNEKQPDLHLEAAGLGAWVEFDGIREASLERHLECVKNMIRRGQIGRTLISMDSGWYRVGEPGGGRYRGYEILFTEFLPALRKAGISEAQIEQLLVGNPRQALQPRIRLV